MESEKVKEIKDILSKEVAEFQSEFCQEILTLINELESENKWLVGKVKEKVNEMTTYTVNNQKLKDRIAALEEEKKTIKESCNRGIDRIHELSIKIAELKEEKQKQLLDFVKALKTITCEMYLKEQLHGAIDITLKNFVKDI